MKVSTQKINARCIDYEEALEETGLGRFNNKILIVCGIGMLANGVQNGISAYLLPSMKCEFNMSASEMANVNVSFMIGGILSACLWGIISDVKGERFCLMIAFMADSFATLLGCLSQNYLLFLFSRLLNGFFIGCPGCLLFAYLSDLTPRKVKSKFICCIGFCFILSWIVLPTFALAIIPLEIDIYLFNIIKINSWRLLMLIFILPSLISSLLIVKFSETPKYYLNKGYRDECLCILRKIFEENTGQLPSDYKINKEIILISDSHNIHDCTVKNENDMSNCFQNMKNSYGNITILFSRPFFIKTLNLMFIMFANMFGCFGFGLWIPEILQQMRHSQNNLSNNSLTCQSESRSIINIVNGNSDNFIVEEYKNIDTNHLCQSTLDVSTYRDTILIGAACLIYNTFSLLLSQHVSPKKLLTLSLSLAGVAAFLFILVNSSSINIFAICVFQAATITANIITATVVIESFPSNLSAMAICVTTLAGRIGAICSNSVFGFLMEVSCHFPIFLVAALSIGGAILVPFVVKHNIKNENDENKLKEIDTIDNDFNLRMFHI